MNQEISALEVLTEQRDGLGIITLNRPKALNALTIDMIRMINGTLKKWESDPAVQAVLFMGAGERAFCAGGDLKGFHRAGMNFRRGVTSLKSACAFFAEEYSLNLQIYHYAKPTIAFMDGIIMGGGYGIGGNCRHRIITEKTLFAMPETGIGFFPDVGAAYHLLKAPNYLGRYLALSAQSIGPADILEAQLAEHFVSSARHDELVQTFIQTKNIPEILKSFSESVPKGGIFKNQSERIARIFRDMNVKRILKELGEDTTPFALETLALIESRSPTSVLVTAEHLRRSESKSFDDVIAEDFILAQRFLERIDFYEGIRAAVIDKNRNAQWNPKEIEAVKVEDVQSHFVPTGHNLEILSPPRIRESGT